MTRMSALNAERVCPECGSSAGTQAFCGSCGRNLLQETRLPTRAEWADPKGDENPAPSGPESHPTGGSRPRSAPAGLWWRDRRVIAGGGVALAAIVAAVILATAGSDQKRPSEGFVSSYIEQQTGAQTVCERFSDGTYFCNEVSQLTGEKDPCGKKFDVQASGDNLSFTEDPASGNPKPDEQCG